MANTTDYKAQLEQHAYDILTSNLTRQVTRFFGTANAQQLYNFLKGRLNTVKGTVYLRAARVNADPVDTIGEAYHADFRIEFICAHPPIRENQLTDRDRETSKMITEVRNQMITNPVTIGGDKFRIYWVSEDELFRDDQIDAQLLTMQISSAYIEF